MPKTLTPGVRPVAVLLLLMGIAPQSSRAQTPQPIVFDVRFPSPEKHVAEVLAAVPTNGRAAIETMMAVWSPGFYRIEDYAKEVESFQARTPEGTELEVAQPAKNRWRIRTRGGP